MRECVAYFLPCVGSRAQANVPAPDIVAHPRVQISAQGEPHERVTRRVCSPAGAPSDGASAGADAAADICVHVNADVASGSLVATLLLDIG